MKRFFSYLAATAMLFAASCSNEDLGTNNANDTQVTFNLSLEGQSGTRAIGDGTRVNELYYAVFEKGATTPLEAYKCKKVADVNSFPANVRLTLAKDLEYVVVFWAQKANAYQVSENAVVTINYNVAGNLEDRDAFFIAHPFKVTGSEQINVLLERPFAQLNVGVTEDDYNAAVASGVTIKKSWAKVTGVYNTLNLLSGEATGEVDAEFALAQRPEGQTLDVELNGTEGIQDDEKFQYLSMNYILAGDRKNVKASFRFENENGSKKINFNSGLDAVPVERNYRTNLVGQILTGTLDFNVKIDANFKGDHNNNKVVNANVKTAQDLLEAFVNEDVDVIVLQNDIQLTDVITKATTADPNVTIAAGRELTIDLNGKKLWAESQANGNREMFTVKGTLTIMDGTITYEHKGSNMGWNAMSTLFDVTAGGVLNLNGVTAKNLGGTDMSFVAHLNNWGTATLNVENCTLEAPYIAVRVFNSGNDMNNVTIKNSTLKGKYCFWVHNYKAAGDNVGEDATLNIDIFNGTNTFNHTNSYNAPVLYGFNEPIYYLCDGLAKNGKTYTVTNANGLVALSGETITIKGGETVKLGANIDLKDIVFNGLNASKPENNNTFDGQGYTVSNWTNNSNASDMGFIRNWVGTIKNVKFENCHLKTAGRSAIAAANVYGNIENVTVNNCSIEDSYWACGIIAGLYNSGSISNCTVTNSSVKSNGGTGAIVGVINESEGERKVENCKVENCTINNTGVYGENYTGGALVGMFNVDGATYKIVDCTVSNNTLEGEYVFEKYPANENVVE